VGCSFRNANREALVQGSSISLLKTRLSGVKPRCNFGHGPTCAVNTFFAIVRCAPLAETTTRSVNSPEITESISSPRPHGA
jgi:hypothetical protein